MRRSTLFIIILAGFLVSFLIGRQFGVKEPTPGQLRGEIKNQLENRFLKSNGIVMTEPEKTTSESQSYFLLISVIANDKEKFDQVWQWTKTNLQIRGDGLFAWRWENGKVADRNSATDADQDIALALYYASKKWGDANYLEESKKIITDIWNKDTKEVAGERYITAGDWVLNESGAILNPSYFSPYAYRIFAQIDPGHNWNGLIDSSYFILNKCSNKPGLPPDWCRLDTQGSVSVNFTMNGKPAGNYSYDALRVPFRIGLDYLIYKEPRALAFIQSNHLFENDWRTKGKIFTIYSSNGEAQGDTESLAHYGALVAAFRAVGSPLAGEIFKEKIAKSSFQDKSFYDLAWAWFGLSAYDGSWPS